MIKKKRKKRVWRMFVLQSGAISATQKNHPTITCGTSNATSFRPTRQFKGQRRAPPPRPLKKRTIKSLIGFGEGGRSRSSCANFPHSTFSLFFSPVPPLFRRLHFLSACRKWKIHPSLYEGLRIHHLPMTASPWKPVQRGNRRGGRMLVFCSFFQISA